MFILSMYDLLDRVDEKIKTLEFYNSKISESWDTAQRGSNDYNYANNFYQLENEFNKNLCTIQEDFTLLTNLTKEVVNLIQEDHIAKMWKTEEKEEIQTLDKSNIGVSTVEEDLPRFASKIYAEEDKDNTESVNLLGLSTNIITVRIKITLNFLKSLLCILWIAVELLYD